MKIYYPNSIDLKTIFRVCFRFESAKHSILLILLLFCSNSLLYSQGGETCAAAKANIVPLPWDYNDLQVCKVNDDFDQMTFGPTNCGNEIDRIVASLEIGEWLYHFSSPVPGVVTVDISDFKNAGSPGSIRNFRNGSFSIIKNCPGSSTGTCVEGFSYDWDLINAGQDFVRTFAIEPNSDYYIVVENRSLPVARECIQFDLKVDFQPEVRGVIPVSSSGCNNMDFTNGNLDGWLQEYGHSGRTDDNAPFPIFSTLGEGPMVGYTGQIHTGGNDPNSDDLLPRVKPTSTHSYQMGTVNAQGSKGEKLSQTFVVQSGKELLEYSYALIQQGVFFPAINNFFKVELLDEDGNEIPNSGVFRFPDNGLPDYGGVRPPGYFAIPSWTFGSGTVYYRPWETVEVDLSSYVGKKVTLIFTLGGNTNDNDRPFKQNRAYLEAKCKPLSMCSDTIDASPDATIGQGNSTTLTATPSSGSPTYTWTASPADASLTGQENTQSPTVTPRETTTYTVTADFGGGCTDTDMVTVTLIIPSDPCSVNLLENGSMETIDGDPNNCLNEGCGFGGSENLNRAVGWDSYHYSPDLYFPAASGCRPFYNSASDATPQDGDYYAGFQVFWPYGSAPNANSNQYEIREFPGSILCCPLVRGVPYRVSGYFRRGWAKRFIVNKLGFRFARNPTTSSRRCGPGKLARGPAHIQTDMMIGDEWTLVEGTFLADREYTHILAGAFAEKNEISFTDGDNDPFRSLPAYYNVDNMKVQPLGAWIENTNYETEITINSGETITLEAYGNGPYNWISSTGTLVDPIKNPMVKPLVTTTYSIFRDLGCAKVTTTITVIVLDNNCTDNITIGPDVTINSGDTTTLTATPSGGTPTYTWTASPADGSLAGQENAQNPTVSPSVTTTYTVTADFGGGCTDMDTVTVTVIKNSCEGPNLVPNPGFENFIQCPPGSFTFENIADYIEDWFESDNTTPDFYNYGCRTDYAFIDNMPVDTSGNNFIGLGASPNEDPTLFGKREYAHVKLKNKLQAGVKYNISLRLSLSDQSDLDGLIDRFGVYFTNTTPNFASTPPLNYPTTAPSVTTSSGNYIDNIGTWKTYNIEYIANGTEQYVTFGIFREFLEAETIGRVYLLLDDVAIRQAGILLNTTNLEVMNADCGQTNGSITGITLSGNSGSETYSWTDASGMEVGTSIDLTGVGQGDYTLIVTDGSCVTTAGPFNLLENGAPILNANNIILTNADCGQTNGGITGISVSGASGSETYSWTDDTGTEVGTSIDLTNVDQGNYTLTVTDVSCNATAGPFTLLENAPFIVEDTDIDSIASDCDLSNGSISGISVSGASGSETYQWVDQDGNSVGSSLILSGVGLGSYTLTVTDGDCSATLGPYDVDEEDNCQDPISTAIQIANTMTPNGDGSNDMFMIAGLSAYPNNRLYIFNRWGNKIYEASNYQNDWYGRYQNKELPVATYYYILELNDLKQQIHKGYITIVR